MPPSAHAGRRSEKDDPPLPDVVMMHSAHRCGYVAIIGRPNVGKSTLLNRLLGEKLSITSRKPQTTRVRLLGIKSGADYQAIYIDTPGLQRQPSRLFNRYMNREAASALADVNAVIQVIEALIWTDVDGYVNALARHSGAPVVLAVNKIDRVKRKEALLPFMKKVSGEEPFAEIIPLSAKTGKNVEALEQCIIRLLPPGPPLFPATQISDRNERFFAAEYLREKLTRRLCDELPYNISVTIDRFQERHGMLNISATVWVASAGQKAIVIGRGGAVLKKVGEQARRDMEGMFGSRVYLQTWVKIREKWTTRKESIRQLGYDF